MSADSATAWSISAIASTGDRSVEQSALVGKSTTSCQIWTPNAATGRKFDYSPVIGSPKEHSPTFPAAQRAADHHHHHDHDAEHRGIAYRIGLGS